MFFSPEDIQCTEELLEENQTALFLGYETLCHMLFSSHLFFLTENDLFCFFGISSLFRIIFIIESNAYQVSVI